MAHTVTDPIRQFLRHTIATLSYRAAKAVRGVPVGFGDYRVADGIRTPAEIVAHIGDLFDWALTMARGQRVFHESTPLPWPQEVERLFDCLGRFDAYLASDAPLVISADILFQGPIADALTHVGQLTMLRRASGSAIKGESYAMAEIVVGRVGIEQTPAKREFD